jgi:hypothetical protein
MLKVKHFRHPMGTASCAKALIAAHLEMWRLADKGTRRFGDDPRYDLRSVTDGFASRVDDRSDDTALLERICTAYILATKQQELAPRTYAASKWWSEVRHRSLGPVTGALRRRDIDGLRAAYRNFFRDPCSTGLIGAPYGMSGAYFGKTIRDIYRRYYLSDALYQIDYWAGLTEGKFALADLATPNIGNPFGVVLEGTLVEAGAPYRHYCARRVTGLLASEAAAVAEIGGGFGGMAYYFLRDRPGMKYLDFDVPESIALTSYYLMKSFPQLKFSLYAEKESPEQAIAQSDVVLLPLFEMQRTTAECVDLTFSSHAMSDVSSAALTDYLNQIARMTRRCFLHVGVERADEPTSGWIGQCAPRFKLAEMRPSKWHNHKTSTVAEVECVYAIGDANMMRYRSVSA